MAERTLAATPGWLYLAVGLALLSGAVLVPPWLDCREMAATCRTMREQAGRLDAERRRYATLVDSLAADDPVLLERLMYLQWRMKVRGKELVSDPMPDPAGLGRESLNDTVVMMWPEAEVNLFALSSARPSVSAAPTPPIDAGSSRLTRLLSGTSRVLVVISAALCIAGGLLWGPSSPRQAREHAIASPGQGVGTESA